MLDYDAEAARYDRTRGGVPRAEAAARAVRGLVPVHASMLLDVACGTGLVTARLVRPGRCPSRLASELRRGDFRVRGMAPTATEPLAAAMEALPEPDRPRPDPRFRLLALERSRLTPRSR